MSLDNLYQMQLGYLNWLGLQLVVAVVGKQLLPLVAAVVDNQYIVVVAAVVDNQHIVVVAVGKHHNRLYEDQSMLFPLSNDLERN